MSNIKSISHQSIHSTQSAPAEATQKNSEIVKESKPAEFRPLTKEQQEKIKQSRTAENKLAESAMMAKASDSLPSDSVPKAKYGLKNAAFKAAGEAASKAGLGSAAVVKEAADEAAIIGKDPSPYFMPFPLPHAKSKKAESEIIKTEGARDFDHDVNTPGADPSQTGPIVSQKMKDGIKELFGEKGGNAENKLDEPVLKAEKFFPSIRFEPSTPILDGETEREEEPVTAWESPKTKAPEEHFEIPPGDNSSRIASKNEGE